MAGSGRIARFLGLVTPAIYQRHYRARELFLTPRAAGTVNATPCEPGLGTRVVVDTDNKLSIAGGKLLLSPRTSSVWGDPALWLDVAITRVVGQRAYGVVKVASEYTYCMFGYDTDKTLVLSGDAAYFFHDGTLFIYDSGIHLPSVLSVSGGTEYPICLICAQGGGVHLFIHISGNWLYYGKWGKSTSTPLYLGIANYTATIEADNFIVPVTLKLPAPLSSDGFGGTYPTTDGLGHPEGVSGVIGSGGAGKTWVGSTWAIVGSALVNTPTLGAEQSTGNLVVGNWYSITATEVDHFYAGCAVGNTFRAAATTVLDANNKVKLITLSTLFTSISESTPDIVASANLTLTSDTQAGFVLCLDSAGTPTNFIIVYCDGVNVKVDKCVAGTYTNVLSGAVTYGAGYMLRVDINDGVGRVYYNNLLVGTFTVADAGVKDNVLHGLFSTYSANSIDNYHIYAKGTGGEHAQLGVI